MRLWRAQAKDYDVPAETLDAALRYLIAIQDHLDPRWGLATRYTLSAYAVYVLELSGRPVPNVAQQVFGTMPLEEAPMEGLGWLLPSLSASNRGRVLDLINNRISETAATAQITSRYEDKGYLVLHADRRDDAVLLESLIRLEPESDVIVKLVRGLMAARVQGRWGQYSGKCLRLVGDGQILPDL